jgi:hypothetical protein
MPEADPGIRDQEEGSRHMGELMEKLELIPAGLILICRRWGPGAIEERLRDPVSWSVVGELRRKRRR